MVTPIDYLLCTYHTRGVFVARRAEPLHAYCVHQMISKLCDDESYLYHHSGALHLGFWGGGSIGFWGGSRLGPTSIHRLIKLIMLPGTYHFTLLVFAGNTKPERFTFSHGTRSGPTSHSIGERNPVVGISFVLYGVRGGFWPQNIVLLVLQVVLQLAVLAPWCVILLHVAACSMHKYTGTHTSLHSIHRCLGSKPLRVTLPASECATHGERS